MFNVQTLNKISKTGLSRLGDNYSVADDVQNPDAVLVRSASMHEMEMPESLLAIARAGAGVNNIPLDKCSEKGIVVFNTPGANANAVKELVLTGLLLSSRKVVDGIEYNVYTILISNQKNNGTHFSSKNARSYQNNGALKKDDAELFSIFLQNDNQAEVEGHLPDMIIANQEFGMREPLIAGWDPNDYRFIYGEGGNNETQRFQYYNRVALYGSVNVVENLAQKTINSVKYYNVAGMESNEPFDGVNIKVTTYNDGTTSTCKVIK